MSVSSDASSIQRPSIGLDLSVMKNRTGTNRSVSFYLKHLRLVFILINVTDIKQEEDDKSLIHLMPENGSPSSPSDRRSSTTEVKRRRSGEDDAGGSSSEGEPPRKQPFRTQLALQICSNSNKV